tara:strand:+ start:4322 stop:4540 length:219 start_codon:yes stop_codon:yes gene_type:complete
MESYKNLKVGDKLHEDEVISQGYINMLEDQDQAFKELVRAYSNYCLAMNKQIDVKGLFKLTNYVGKWSERIK